ncbi:MAG: four helix bundle protein [Chloroflexota bacterium]
MNSSYLQSIDAWVEQVPDSIKKDPLWKLEVYRDALFLFDLIWHDCEILSNHTLGKPIADQLIRSGGSITANMEEGFGRGYGKDYARFLRYSIGSAREARGWYYRGRRLLKPEVIQHRMQLLDKIIGSLIPILNNQKNR